MEITQTGQQTERQMKKNKRSIRDLWDNIKWANLCRIGIPEGEEKEKGIENIFEEIMGEDFPNLKHTDSKVQEAQRKQAETKQAHTKTYYNKNGKNLKIKRRFQRQQEKSKALIIREPP